MKISNFLQSGRSMVETLGVLAIVGVLSVGSIAGYSKAMMKYKMNKFSVAMNEMLNTAIQYSGQLNSSSNADDGAGAQYFANILHKMHALPDGIKYKNAWVLEDMFGNKIWTFAYPNQAIPYYGLGYTLSVNGSNTLSSKICHKLIKISQENSSQLWYININSKRYHGDSACTEDGSCLKTMTISDVDTACHSCTEESECRFYLIWK